MGEIARRDFLKAASVAGVASALRDDCDGDRARRRLARTSSAAYTPRRDYPIRAQRAAAVTITDDFWQPKLRINADVTIPIEVRSSPTRRAGLPATCSKRRSCRSSRGRIRRCRRRWTRRSRAWRRAPDRGNSGFEVAATYYTATGRRDLLDRAIAGRRRPLPTSSSTTNPPFSGGERDAINCVQLYRVTHDKKHLDLAKHYLDIRGLENSVNRSRHNQSYTAGASSRREAVGHAVNCVSLMVSLADVGVLTGLKDVLHGGRAAVARCRREEAVRHRRRRHDRQRGIRRTVRRSRTSPPTRKRARC